MRRADLQRDLSDQHVDAFMLVQQNETSSVFSLKQEATCKPQSPSRPPCGDAAGAPGPQRSSPSLPPLAEMKPTGKHTLWPCWGRWPFILV